MAGEQQVEMENPELYLLTNNKESGFKYRERREEQWKENYELYRDNVTINRLTQRQSVNLPLMKTTLRSLLKDIDDMPVIVFENLDNDKEAEIFQNEYWKWTLEQNKAEVQDVVDKKQDFFFGRTFDSWQVEDGRIRFDVEDPEDILVDRFMNPYDIDSSRFLIHTHIFVPLSSLKNNKDYDQEAVSQLEEFYKSEQGIVKAQDNENSLQAKNQKLSDMGVTDIEDPKLGETIVELSIHYVHRDVDDIDQIWVYVEAENMVILMKKPQEEIIGVTEDNYWRDHYRYNTWADDIDKQDFWTDGIADIVRTPNKVVNAWFSQEIERRTMNNFGMHYYDSALQAEGFAPDVFEPMPWGWYPVPTGTSQKLSDVFQKVELPGDVGSLEFNNWVVQMLEKATGATATQQGVQTEKQVTLGEVQLAQAEAKARIQGVSKFYTHAWKMRAEKFLKLIEAASDKLDAVEIYKEGRNSDKLYKREISPTNWMTKSGYRVRVWSQDEKQANDLNRINKLQAAVNIMPDNPRLREINQRKLLEFAELTPDEITQVMDAEEQKNQLLLNGGLPQDTMGVPGARPPSGRAPAGQPVNAYA